MLLERAEPLQDWESVPWEDVSIWTDHEHASPGLTRQAVSLFDEAGQSLELARHPLEQVAQFHPAAALSDQIAHPGASGDSAADNEQSSFLLDDEEADQAAGLSTIVAGPDGTTWFITPLDGGEWGAWSPDDRIHNRRCHSFEEARAFLQTVYSEESP